MGPPPFGSGNMRRCRALRVRNFGLQWGHRLSVVETTSPSRRGSIHLRLQWGHRLSVVETRGPGQSARQRAEASMGPPPFGSGNTLTPPSGDEYLDASMGPPPFGSGNRLVDHRHTLLALASMGPPPFGSGNQALGVLEHVQVRASMGPPPFGSGNGSLRLAYVADAPDRAVFRKKRPQGKRRRRRT